MKLPVLPIALFTMAAASVISARVEIVQPDARAEKSTEYEVTVDGKPLFVTRFRAVSYASFSQDSPASVTVRGSDPVTSYNISPHSAGIPGTIDGRSLTFTLDRPRQVIVTLNNGGKLLLFSNSIESGAPKPGAPGVISALDRNIDPTGQRLETARLQKAIDDAAAAKGTLYLPPGVYRTGSLSLKSDLTLYLAEGARLLGSDNPEDYPADAGWDESNLRYDPDLWFRMGRVDAAYRRFLLVDNAHNVQVRGRGIVDGRGKLLRFKKNISFILVRQSSGVVFEDITLLDSPCYNAHVLASDHVTFRNVKIVSDQEVPNTDGVDPDSSKDVLVEGCFLMCADDCISPKTSGQTKLTGDLERLTVRDSILLSRTSATKFGNESFAGMMRDITFENVDAVEGDRAIVVSCLDGNGYENVRFINFRIETLLGIKRQYPIQLHTRQRKPGGPSGHIHDVLFRNVTVEHEYAQPSRLAGFDAQNDVRGVRFENYVMAGRVRLSAEDAHVQIGPFVSDVTFSR